MGYEQLSNRATELQAIEQLRTINSDLVGNPHVPVNIIINILETMYLTMYLTVIKSTQKKKQEILIDVFSKTIYKLQLNCFFFKRDWALNWPTKG